MHLALAHNFEQYSQMQWRLGQRDDIHRRTMLKSVLKSAIFRARPELIFHPFVARSVRPTVSGMLWNKWVPGYADREHLNRSYMNGIYLHHFSNHMLTLLAIWQSGQFWFQSQYFFKKKHTINLSRSNAHSLRELCLNSFFIEYIR